MTKSRKKRLLQSMTGHYQHLLSVFSMTGSHKLPGAKPTNEFWRFVIEDLGSRYVIFEFKNYRERISQGQILTTEKYLLERGLRRVAFLLTRAGADDGALKMAKGAMREHGKLMLVLDDALIEEMLLKRDGGSDPADILFDKADDFMLTLSR